MAACFHDWSSSKSHQNGKEDEPHLSEDKYSYLPNNCFDWSVWMSKISMKSSLHCSLLNNNTLSQVRCDHPVHIPISLPVAKAAVGINVICPNFEMIKHNLNLKFNEAVRIRIGRINLTNTKYSHLKTKTSDIQI